MLENPSSKVQKFAPYGWRIVPSSPTVAMLHAAKYETEPRKIYKAMLLAAPTFETVTP